MVVLNTKTFNELSEETTENLAANGFSTAKNAVAKLFMNIVDYVVSNFYNALIVNHRRAFLSSSDGDALDEIGYLLNCDRNDMDDDNYRTTISEQTHILASGNETALNAAVRNIDGVLKFKYKPTSMGAGSFTLIVVYDPLADKDSVKAEIQEAISNTYAYGVRYNIVEPTPHYVSIKQQLSIKNTASDMEKQEIRYAAKTALTNYLNTLEIGETIYIDRITQLMMDSDSLGRVIEDVNLDFKIDGERAFYVNQTTRWFERFALVPDDSESVVIL